MLFKVNSLVHLKLLRTILFSRRQILWTIMNLTVVDRSVFRWTFQYIWNLCSFLIGQKLHSYFGHLESLEAVLLLTTQNLTTILDLKSYEFMCTLCSTSKITNTSYSWQDKDWTIVVDRKVMIFSVLRNIDTVMEFLCTWFGWHKLCSFKFLLLDLSGQISINQIAMAQ